MYMYRIGSKREESILVAEDGHSPKGVVTFVCNGSTCV